MTKKATDFHDTARAIINKFITNENPEEDNVEQQMLRDQATIYNTLNEQTMESITEDEVKDYLDGINVKRACGIDEIPGIVLKTVSVAISDYIAGISNDCIHFSHFPKTWKRGLLITIPKDKKESNPLESRPLTLLPLLAKGLEHFIRKSIFRIVEEDRFYHEIQIGFIKGKSTKQAMDLLIAEVKQPNKYNTAIFLDIKGAFDNAWWPTMLDSLKAKNLPNKLYNIIVSYFLAPLYISL